MSLATLTGLRVGKDIVSLYGKTNNVPIPPALVVSHINARQKYHDRIENEKKEKARERERIQGEMRAATKRKAEEKDTSDYLTKKKRLEDEEKEKRDILKFHETRRAEFSSRMENPSGLAEMKSAFALQKQIDDSIAKTRTEIETIVKKKYSLVESRANKK